MNEAQLAWPLISILGSVAAIVVGVVAVVKLNRRVPPLPEEMAKNYIHKPEFNAAVCGINSRIDGVSQQSNNAVARLADKFDALINTLHRNAMDTERALGRIEGKLNEHVKEEERNDG
jgi:hypothetical protein